MWDEAFGALMKDMYAAYRGKIADSEGILNLLHSHDDSAQIVELIAFYLK